MRRIPKPKQTVLRTSGVVSLLKLEATHYDGHPIYAVRYPHSVGHEESTLYMTSQFLSKPEADREFYRYAQFFAERQV